LKIKEGEVTNSIIFCGPFGESIKDKGEKHIVRWHNLPISSPLGETVAAHTYDVITNAWTIGRLLLSRGFQINMFSLLEQAMFHDIEEKVTGDIPSDFKKSFKIRERRVFNKLTETVALGVIEGRFPSPLSELVFQRWQEARKRETLESQVVHVSDLMSAINFLEDELFNLGNGFLRAPLRRAVKEIIELKSRYSWLPGIWDLIFGQTAKDLLQKLRRDNL
jgi:5'-deoxynucleotidase YfbR-like HD superfamily hydrolase